MKAGILTFSNANNIGALLQAYALQEYVKSLGVDVKHINFKFTVLNKKKYLVDVKKSRINKFRSRIIGKKKRRVLKRFRDNYLDFDKQLYIDKIDSSNEYNFIIAGSDQIWNTDLNGHNETFYLNFLANGRYTYAASVGRVLTEEDKILIENNIKNFTKISVREKELKQYLEEKNVESELVLDPVFLLDKNQWKNIQKKISIPKKFVFVYIMESNDTIKNVALFAANKYANNTIVWHQGGGEVFDFPGKKVDIVSPNQFLYLINHCACVVTNSFHGAAFSTIFNKPMFLVSHKSRNSRLEQLAENFGCCDKIIRLEDIVFDNKIINNYEHKILAMKENSKKYIEDIVKFEKENN